MERTFLLPSFLDLEVKEREKMIKFLSLLNRYGVGNVIDKYINNNTGLGGRPGYDYYHLFATILYDFAFGRYT